MQSSNSNRSSPGTSVNLLRGVGRGDNEAWNQLVGLYLPRILAICRSKGLDENSSQDVAQESFVTVYRSLASFHSSPGSGAFRAWLHTIVERRIADWYRRAGRQEEAVGGSTFAERINSIPEEPDDSASHSPKGHSYLCAVLGSDFQLVAEKYKPRTWQAFLRCVVDGRSTQQVADEFCMTTVGVRQLRSRILRQLRASLESHSSNLPPIP